ncbi:MAG TPA: potassium channel family protein [Verrucomicrobiae bacterium]|nr:potassium channel family protein [Verrucomicrobiae bacterium]
MDVTAAPSKPPTDWHIFIEVLVRVWPLTVIFTIVIFMCAGLYYFGSPHGWGVQPTFSTSTANTGAIRQPLHTPVDFLECLHFSVVTITTLGYGDFRAESFGRLISGTEVLVGVVLMGIFVARLVSHQQDRYIRRLVRGQLNAEIQDFRDQLAALLRDFSLTPLVLGQPQPCHLLYRARGLTQSIARFWRHEMSEPYMSEVVPSRAVGRMLGELIEILKAVVAGVRTKTKADIRWEDFKAVRGISEATLVISTCLTELLDDPGLHHSHECVIQLVKGLRERLDMRHREAPR